MNILVTPQFGIGDALMTTPALSAIKSSHPDWKITVLAIKKSIYEIFFNNPNIDNLLFVPLMEWNRLKAILFLIRNLRKRYDVTINFYPSNRKEYNIFSFLTGSKIRIGHRYIKNDLREANFLKNYTIKEAPALHCVEENLRLLRFLGIEYEKYLNNPLEIYLTQREIEEGKSIFDSFKREINIGIHPGTSLFKNHIKRRWPKEYFVELIRSFKKENVRFFIFGTDEEKEEISYIKENTKDTILIFNKPIRQVASIIKNLNLFISNDSGLMHLSAAVGTSTLGIFGPTNPSWVRPWGKENRVVCSDVKCSPCFFYSPKPLICKNKDKFLCLKSISPEKVKEIAIDMLENI